MATIVCINIFSEDSRLLVGKHVYVHGCFSIILSLLAQLASFCYMSSKWQENSLNETMVSISTIIVGVYAAY
jgi:hypothetical protein